MRLVLTAAVLLVQPLTAQTEIQSKHFLRGYPTGTPATNDLIIRDLYALSSNDQTKFADWVAYRLTPYEVMGTNALDRNFRSDPLLDPTETLETSDFVNLSSVGYQRGHLAPLASFKGSAHASQVNYWSNIVPQRGPMNDGPWGDLEQDVRDIVCTGTPMWVMTGPLYDGPTPAPLLPRANESHTVPTSFWKIVANENLTVLAGFIIDQEATRNSDPEDFLVSVATIQTRSGLDFFRELDDATERALEGITMSAATWNSVVPVQGCPAIPS